MPKSLQMYKGDPIQQFKASNGEKTAEFGATEMGRSTNKFVPEDDSDQGLDIAKDFVFNPKKFFCPSHPSVEIEYCN